MTCVTAGVIINEKPASTHTRTLYTGGARTGNRTEGHRRIRMLCVELDSVTCADNAAWIRRVSRGVSGGRGGEHKGHESTTRHRFSRIKECLTPQRSSRVSGVLVNMLATGPNGRWFKPGRCDGFFKAISPQHTFLQTADKA
jgi:hypothetical protein